MSRWSYALSPCWNSENLLFLGDSKETVYPRASHIISVNSIPSNNPTTGKRLTLKVFPEARV